MNYLEIFDDVVSIVHNDYSGCVDKRGWDNPDLFRKKLVELQHQDSLTPEVFQQIVEDYLLDFKDAHMYFRLTGNLQKLFDIGFKCRRYQDKLYITQAGRETRLQPGMAITALDHTPILELAEKHKRRLQVKGDTAEREVWEPVIMMHSTCTVMDKNGTSFELPLDKYEAERYVPEYSLKKLDNDILLMKLTDFSDNDAVVKLLEDNKELLDTSRSLIIDVRLNRGGSDSAFLKLLEYIFPKEVDLNELDDSVMQAYMSPRNYRLRMETYQMFVSTIKDPESIKFTYLFMKELEKHKDTVGLVEMNLLDGSPELIIKGRKNPENIVVLSDLYCGSSGDAFVQISALSDKVTFMGRGTAGITDYSNLAIQKYGDDFMFMYPTSRSGSIDMGKGLTGKGVQPDIYIPWTPEHIERDVDLERAVEYLLNK